MAMSSVLKRSQETPQPFKIHIFLGYLTQLCSAQDIWERGAGKVKLEASIFLRFALKKSITCEYLINIKTNSLTRHDFLTVPSFSPGQQGQIT